MNAFEVQKRTGFGQEEIEKVTPNPGYTIFNLIEKEVHFHVIGKKDTILSIDWGSSVLEDFTMTGEPVTITHVFPLKEKQKVTFSGEGNVELTNIYCGNNEIFSLDISGNAKLIIFQCGWNPIYEIDISNNKLLQTLSCQECLIKQLCIVNHPTINTIFCQSNMIEYLDLSNNVNLKTILCEDNLISKIKLHGSSELNTLNCRKNKLAFLDLSQNLKLLSLVASENVLEDVKFGENIVPGYIFLDTNKIKEKEVLFLFNKIVNKEMHGTEINLSYQYGSEGELFFSSSQLSLLFPQLNTFGWTITLNIRNLPRLKYFYFKTAKKSISISLKTLNSETLYVSWDDNKKYEIVESDSSIVSLTKEYGSEKTRTITVFSFDLFITDLDVSGNEITELYVNDLFQLNNIDISNNNFSYSNFLDVLDFLYKNITFNNQNSNSNSNSSSEEPTATLNCTNVALTQFMFGDIVGYIKRMIIKGISVTHDNFISECTFVRNFLGNVAFDIAGDGEIGINWDESNSSSLTLTSASQRIEINNSEITANAVIYISNPTAITSLIIKGANGMDISPCINLKELNCVNNYLRNLYLNDNTELEKLICYGNYLKDLDISDNHKIKMIDYRDSRTWHIHYQYHDDVIDEKENLKIVEDILSTGVEDGILCSNFGIFDKISLDFARALNLLRAKGWKDNLPKETFPFGFRYSDWYSFEEPKGHLIVTGAPSSLPVNGRYDVYRRNKVIQKDAWGNDTYGNEAEVKISALEKKIGNDFQFEMGKIVYAGTAQAVGCSANLLRFFRWKGTTIGDINELTQLENGTPELPLIEYIEPLPKDYIVIKFLKLSNLFITGASVVLQSVVNGLSHSRQLKVLSSYVTETDTIIRLSETLDVSGGTIARIMKAEEEEEEDTTPITITLPVIAEAILITDYSRKLTILGFNVSSQFPPDSFIIIGSSFNANVERHKVKSSSFDGEKTIIVLYTVLQKNHSSGECFYRDEEFGYPVVDTFKGTSTMTIPGGDYTKIFPKFMTIKSKGVLESDTEELFVSGSSYSSSKTTLSLFTPTKLSYTVDYKVFPMGISTSDSETGQGTGSVNGPCTILSAPVGAMSIKIDSPSDLRFFFFEGKEITIGPLDSDESDEEKVIVSSSSFVSVKIAKDTYAVRTLVELTTPLTKNHYKGSPVST